MSLLILFLMVGTLTNQASCAPGGFHMFIERAPYMASLRLNGTYHWCSASIIHEQFLLTAAHCIDFNQKYQVLVGTENEDGGELLDIEEISIHDDYNSKNYENDVSLIKLKTPLTFGRKVGKIYLADAVLHLDNYKGLFNVTGREVIKSDVKWTLVQAEVPMVNDIACKKAYSTIQMNITSNMVCAGNTALKHKAYKVDSGGPLTLGNVLVGINSFTICPASRTAVYTKISSVICWIMEKITLL